MKGQASLEAIFILASVLLIATGFIVQGQGSSNSVNAVSAAQTGAENAINTLEMENDVKLEIKKLSITKKDEIRISIKFWSGNLSNSYIEQHVREDALKYLYQAFNGDFPRNADPVSTSNHNFDVNVKAERVGR